MTHQDTFERGYNFACNEIIRKLEYKNYWNKWKPNPHQDLIDEIREMIKTSKRLE